MRKAHIIAIIVIAAAIGTIISAISDSGTYASFAEAFANPGTKYHVVGQLSRNKEMNYDPQSNPDLFSFYMMDNNGLEKQVVLHQSKPQDFDRSEQIVVIGKAETGAFHASDILLKCPSKYTDGSQDLASANNALN